MVCSQLFETFDSRQINVKKFLFAFNFDNVHQSSLTPSIEVTLPFNFSSVFSKYAEIFSGASDYALQLTDFHIKDQKTDADLHKLKVYRENLLEITGSLTTNVPVTANSFTTKVRLNINGMLYFLGMPLTVNQAVDCPDSLTSSSDAKQWYVHDDIL